jgi:hypothetical protein
MRVRYWRLSITDVLNATYPAEKANHWDIKCMQGEYEHFGVFWYRYGTPFDKEPVHGLCFYYNDVPRKIIDDLTSEESYFPCIAEAFYRVQKSLPTGDR